MLTSNVLIIFAKYPEPGLVKSRLAKTIGEEKAAGLYRLFVETIMEKTKDEKYESILFYAPAVRRKDFEHWLGNEIKMCPQSGETLGKRLSSAFQSVFQNGAKRVVVIGTDSPLLDKELIQKAFDELKRKDAVIGPSTDGGYYLLGSSLFCKEIFQGIDWSTDKVYQQTLNKLARLKLTHTSLEEHFDVDTAEDLLRISS